MKHSDVNPISLLFELAKKAGADEVLYNAEHHYIYIKPDGPVIDRITNEFRKNIGRDINESRLDDPHKVALMEGWPEISQINPAKLISKTSKNDLAAIKFRPQLLRTYLNTYFIVDRTMFFLFDVKKIQYLKGKQNGLAVVLPKLHESRLLIDLKQFGIFPEGKSKNTTKINPAHAIKPATVLKKVSSIISNALNG